MLSIAIGLAAAALTFSALKAGDRKHESRKIEHELANKWRAQEAAAKQQKKEAGGAAAEGVNVAINAIGAAAKAAADAIDAAAGAIGDDGKAPIIDVPGEDIKDA